MCRINNRLNQQLNIRQSLMNKLMAQLGNQAHDPLMIALYLQVRRRLKSQQIDLREQLVEDHAYND